MLVSKNTLYILGIISTIFFLHFKELFVKYSSVNIPAFAFIFFLIFIITSIFNNKYKLWSKTFYLYYFIIFFTLFNYIFYGIELKRYIYGVYYTFYFFIFFLIYYNLRVKEKTLYSIFHIILYFSIFILLFGFIDLFVNGKNLINLRHTSSIYINNTHYNFMLTIGFIIALHLNSKRKKFIYLLFICLFFAAVLLSTSKKSIISIFIICCISLFYSRWPFFLKTSFFCSGLLIFASILYFYQPIFSRINYLYLGFVTDSGVELSGRLEMYLASLNVAKDYFPFGSSLGTFGGSVASIFYSPLYFEYGISDVLGFYPPKYMLPGYNFLSDFKWTHIIAELGFIFSLIFFVLFFYPIIKFYKLRKFKKYRSTFVLSFSVSTLLFIEGFGSALPENLAFLSLSLFLIFSPHYLYKSKA